jgi:hypothetical protein
LGVSDAMQRTRATDGAIERHQPRRCAISRPRFHRRIGYLDGQRDRCLVGAWPHGYLSVMPHPKAALGSRRRHALAVLVNHSEGCTKTVLMAHGFTGTLIADLIEGGLASRPERSYVGGRPHRVMRIRSPTLAE